nr:MAG TPA: hypothetical protein [Caudoviricetes sp.]
MRGNLLLFIYIRKGDCYCGLILKYCYQNN